MSDQDIICPQCESALTFLNQLYVDFGNEYWTRCECGWGYRSGILPLILNDSRLTQYLKRRRFKEVYGPTRIDRIRTWVMLRIDKWADVRCSTKQERHYARRTAWASRSEIALPHKYARVYDLKGDSRFRWECINCGIAEDAVAISGAMECKI